jgi:DNA polymerase-1
MIKNPHYFELLKKIVRDHEKQTSSNPDESNPNSRILIVDGLNTFIRGFTMSPLLNDDGAHVGGIVSFLLSVGYAIRLLTPTRCVIVFDGKNGSIRRRKLYPDYKNKRSPSTRFNRTDVFLSETEEQESRVRQAKRLVQYLDCLPITCLSIDNVEADDVISYVARETDNNHQNFIMSTDKDFIQLINDKVSVWNPTRKKLYDNSNDVLKDYNVPIENYLLYRAITGDISDNIKGLDGIKEKTLQKILPILFESKNQTIDSILEYCGSLDNKKRKLTSVETLLKSKEILEINYKLMKLDGEMMTSTDKLRITTIINNPIQTLKRHDFFKMINEDKLHAGFKAAHTWLSETFTYLNGYANKTHKE